MAYSMRRAWHCAALSTHGGVLNKNIQHGAACKYNVTPHFASTGLSSPVKEEKCKHDVIQRRRPERFRVFLMKRNICKHVHLKGTVKGIY